MLSYFLSEEMVKDKSISEVNKYRDHMEEKRNTLVRNLGQNRSLILDEVVGLVDKDGMQLLKSMTDDQAGTYLFEYIVENRELAEDFYHIFTRLRVDIAAAVIKCAIEADTGRPFSRKGKSS